MPAFSSFDELTGSKGFDTLALPDQLDAVDTLATQFESEQQSDDPFAEKLSFEELYDAKSVSQFKLMGMSEDDISLFHSASNKPGVFGDFDRMDRGDQQAILEGGKFGLFNVYRENRRELGKRIATRSGVGYDNDLEPDRKIDDIGVGVTVLRDRMGKPNSALLKSGLTGAKRPVDLDDDGNVPQDQFDDFISGERKRILSKFDDGPQKDRAEKTLNSLIGAEGGSIRTVFGDLSTGALGSPARGFAGLFNSVGLDPLGEKFERISDLTSFDKTELELTNPAAGILGNVVNATGQLASQFLTAGATRFGQAGQLAVFRGFAAVQGGGNAYLDAIESGSTEAQARAEGATTAALTVFLEGIAGKTFGKMAESQKKLVTRALATGSVEAGTEAIQAIGEIASADFWRPGENQSVADAVKDLVDAAKDFDVNRLNKNPIFASVTGGFGAGGLAGAAGAGSALADPDLSLDTPQGDGTPPPAPVTGNTAVTPERNRLFGGMRSAMALRGVPEVDTEASLGVVDAMVQATAQKTQQGSEDIYARIQFEDENSKLTAEVVQSKIDRLANDPENEALLDEIATDIKSLRLSDSGEILGRIELITGKPPIVTPDPAPENPAAAEREAKATEALLEIDVQLQELESKPKTEQDLDARDELLNRKSTIIAKEVEQSGRASSEIKDSLDNQIDQNSKRLSELRGVVAGTDSHVERRQARSELSRLGREQSRLLTERRQVLNQSDQSGNRGQIETVDRSQVLITAFENGDASTLLHEMFHSIDLLVDGEGASLLDSALGDSRDSFFDWATDGGKIGRDSVEARERMADGFEAFLREGRAPTTELRGVFQQVADLLRRVYQSLSQLRGIDINTAARRGYDQLFLPEGSREATVDPSGSRPSVSLLSQQAPAAAPEGSQEFDPTPGQHIPESQIPEKNELLSRPIALGQGGITPTDVRTFLTGIGTRARRKLAKLGRSRGLIPQRAFAAKIASEGLQNRLRKEMEFIQQRFEQALNKETGTIARRSLSRAHRRRRQQINTRVNDYMTERDPAAKSAILQSIPPGIRPVAVEMRRATDLLSSELINTGVISGPTAMVVQDNLGSYLHRSYRIFNDPKWKETVRREHPTRVAAVEQMFRQWYPQDTDQQINARIDYYLDPKNFEGHPFEYLAKTGLRGRDNSILKKRKDIPPEIRELWGEYDDPIANFSQSIFKMSNLLATHQFLSDVRQVGEADGWLFPPDSFDTPPDFQSRISSEGSKSLEPLSGWKTSPDIRDALHDAYKPVNWGRLMRTYMLTNSFVKAGKTVLSPVTQVRNFISSGFMFVANGHVSPSAIGKGMAANFADVAPKWMKDMARGVGFDRRAWEDFYGRMIELKIVDEQITASELRENLKDAMSTNVPMDVWATNRLLQGASRAFRAAQRIYMAGDGVWKTAAWLSEVSQLEAASPAGRTMAEIEDEAAERVRNTLPTYSLVPEAIRNLRRFPILGSFVAFPAEVVRTNWNMARYVKEDLATPGRRAMGIRRLAGMIGVHSMPVALYMWSKAVNGIDDEDDKLLREHDAPWDKNSLRYYLSGPSEKAVAKYVNTSYVDPYATLKNPIMAVLKGSSMEDKVVGAVLEAVTPFLGEEILAGAIRQVMSNKDEFGREIYNPDDVNDVVFGSLAHIADAAEPGFVNQTERMKRAISGEQTRTGKIENPVEVAVQTFTGQRVVERDLRTSLGFRASDLKDSINRANRTFLGTARRRGKVDDKELIGDYQRMENLRASVFGQGTRISHGAIRWGVPEPKVMDILEGSQLSKKEAAQIHEGEYEPYQLTEEQAALIEVAESGRLVRVLELIPTLKILGRNGRTVDPQRLLRQLSSIQRRRLAQFQRAR